MSSLPPLTQSELDYAANRLAELKRQNAKYLSPRSGHVKDEDPKVGSSQSKDTSGQIRESKEAIQPRISRHEQEIAARQSHEVKLLTRISREKITPKKLLEGIRECLKVKLSQSDKDFADKRLAELRKDAAKFLRPTPIRKKDTPGKAEREKEEAVQVESSSSNPCPIREKDAPRKPKHVKGESPRVAYPSRDLSPIKEEDSPRKPIHVKGEAPQVEHPSRALTPIREQDTLRKPEHVKHSALQVSSSHSDLSAADRRLAECRKQAARHPSRIPISIRRKDTSRKPEHIQDNTLHAGTNHHDLSAAAHRLSECRKQAAKYPSRIPILFRKKDASGKPEHIKDKAFQIDSSHSDLSAAAHRLSECRKQAAKYPSRIPILFRKKDASGKPENIKDKASQIDSSHSDLSVAAHRLRECCKQAAKYPSRSPISIRKNEKRPGHVKDQALTRISGSQPSNTTPKRVSKDKSAATPISASSATKSQASSSKDIFATEQPVQTQKSVLEDKSAAPSISASSATTIQASPSKDILATEQPVQTQKSVLTDESAAPSTSASSATTIQASPSKDILAIEQPVQTQKSVLKDEPAAPSTSASSATTIQASPSKDILATEQPVQTQKMVSKDKPAVTSSPNSSATVIPLGSSKDILVKEQPVPPNSREFWNNIVAQAGSNSSAKVEEPRLPTVDCPVSHVMRRCTIPQHAERLDIFGLDRAGCGTNDLAGSYINQFRRTTIPSFGSQYKLIDNCRVQLAQSRNHPQSAFSAPRWIPQYSTHARESVEYQKSSECFNGSVQYARGPKISSTALEPYGLPRQFSSTPCRNQFELIDGYYNRLGQWGKHPQPAFCSPRSIESSAHAKSSVEDSHSDDERSQNSLVGCDGSVEPAHRPGMPSRALNPKSAPFFPQSQVLHPPLVIRPTRTGHSSGSLDPTSVHSVPQVESTDPPQVHGIPARHGVASEATSEASISDSESISPPLIYTGPTKRGSFSGGRFAFPRSSLYISQAAEPSSPEKRTVLPSQATNSSEEGSSLGYKPQSHPSSWEVSGPEMNPSTHQGAQDLPRTPTGHVSVAALLASHGPQVVLGPSSSIEEILAGIATSERHIAELRAAIEINDRNDPYAVMDPTLASQHYSSSAEPPKPEQPHRTMRIYDDSIPAAMQPQTPAHLRSVPFPNAAYTAPIGAGTRVEAMTPTRVNRGWGGGQIPITGPRQNVWSDNQENVLEHEVEMRRLAMLNHSMNAQGGRLEGTPPREGRWRVGQ